MANSKTSKPAANHQTTHEAKSDTIESKPVTALQILSKTHVQPKARVVDGKVQPTSRDKKSISPAHNITHKKEGMTSADNQQATHPPKQSGPELKPDDLKVPHPHSEKTSAKLADQKAHVKAPGKSPESKQSAKLADAIVGLAPSKHATSRPSSKKDARAESKSGSSAPSPLKSEADALLEALGVLDDPLLGSLDDIPPDAVELDESYEGTDEDIEAFMEEFDAADSKKPQGSAIDKNKKISDDYQAMAKNDTMKVYMQDIGKISLVSKEEEVELAADIHGDNQRLHDSNPRETCRSGEHVEDRSAGSEENQGARYCSCRHVLSRCSIGVYR